MEQSNSHEDIRELRKVFTTVKTHLLKQNKKSVNSENCTMYHGDDGTRCPIGVLIKDKYYTPNLESFQLDTPEIQYALKKSGINVDLGYMLGLLYLLRIIHDHHEPKDWNENLHVLSDRLWRFV